jgi:hypothetical protein
VKPGRRLALLPLAVALVACPATAPPLVAPTKNATGARWFLHPQWPLEPAASVALPSGATLYAGPDGTRWLRSGAGATAADEVLDAKLVGVAVLPGGGVALTADDGTVYVAPTALGPVQAVRPASEPIRTTGTPAQRALRLLTDAPSQLAGAGAVRAGKGALVRGRWIEIAPEGRDRWRRQASELGSPIHVEPWPVLDGCAGASLAAEGEHAWVACTPRSDMTVVRILESDDGGVRWRAGPMLRTSDAGELHLFALPRGELLVQGACRADAATPCSPLIIGPGAIRDVALDASMRLYALRGRSDGTLYGLGTAGTGITYLVASRDDGAAFSTVELPLLDLCACSPTDQATGLAVGDQGAVVVVAYANADRWLRYASTDYGAHVTGTLLPIAPDAVDLAGRRGLAYGPTGGWETADLGATWVRVPVPWSLDIEAMRKTQVACSDEGCLVDADAARVGWTLPAR